MSELKCEMSHECQCPVTHIDDKGYIYCKQHGNERKSYRRCRQLRIWELKLLKAGQTVPSYERRNRPKQTVDA
jgi:hypothetical protein